MPAPPPFTIMLKKTESAQQVPFSVGEEFVAFTFSNSDEEAAVVPIREWDQGKQNPDIEKRGRKRKPVEISRGGREHDQDDRRDRGHDKDRDRHGEKRQRIEMFPDKLLRLRTWTGTGVRTPQSCK